MDLVGFAVDFECAALLFEVWKLDCATVKMRKIIIRFIPKVLWSRILTISLIGILLFIFITPISEWSYDLSFFFRPKQRVDDLVMVYADERTLQTFGDGHGSIRRTNHSALLNLLARENAKLVFLDFAFIETNSNSQVDLSLINAIRANGNVVLVAAGSDRGEAHESLEGGMHKDFRNAAKMWGHGQMFGNVVRTIPREYAGQQSAAWVAANYIAPSVVVDNPYGTKRWMHYYGSQVQGALPYVYYHDAITNGLPPGTFTDKIVFIGQKFSTGPIGSLKDTFETPWWLLGDGEAYGVFLHATAFLNLIRSDWLYRMPWPAEWLLSVAWVALLSVVLHHVSAYHRRDVGDSRHATQTSGAGFATFGAIIVVGVAASLLLIGISLWLQWSVRIWWGWIVPAVIQSSIALLWTGYAPKEREFLAFISYRWDRDKDTAIRICDCFLDESERVFRDRSHLGTGKWQEGIDKAITGSEVFIIILTTESLKRFGKSIEKSPEKPDPEDQVLRELRFALKTKRRIVCVFKDGFSWDKSTTDMLPSMPEIDLLRQTNGRSYDPDRPDVCVKELLTLIRAQKQL